MEALSRILAGARLSRDDRNALESRLGVVSSSEPSKKNSRWRSSFPAQQLAWEETWDNLGEAQKIVRLIVRAGGMSVASVLQKRGISRWRFDELAPLILANARIGFQPKLNRFVVFPEGPPELAARIAATKFLINRSSPAFPVRLRGSVTVRKRKNGHWVTYRLPS